MDPGPGSWSRLQEAVEHFPDHPRIGRLSNVEAVAEGEPLAAGGVGDLPSSGVGWDWPQVPAFRAPRALHLRPSAKSGFLPLGAGFLPPLIEVPRMRHLSVFLR